MSGDAFEFASCGLCRLELAGECRRRAPAIAADTGRAVWPLVAADDWCGEFRRDPRKVEPQRADTP